MNRKKLYLPTLLQICWDLSEQYETACPTIFGADEFSRAVKKYAGDASSKEEASYLISRKIYGIDPEEASENSNYTGFHYIWDIQQGD